METWSNKVVIVTGGSRGLGASIARAFGRRGAQVVTVARDVQKLDAAAAEMQAEGHKVTSIVADVTDQNDVDRLMNDVIGRFGRLDALINNAGRSDRGEVLSTTPEALAELLNLNLLAIVRCTRAAAQHLLANRGHLVNIGSLAGKSAARYLGAYPPTKFAVTAYTQQLRLELEPRGLHVLLVCPGPIAREQPRHHELPLVSGLPPAAAKPGGGVRTRAISPDRLANEIVLACERRSPELVRPRKARLLFAIAQLSPRLGDWLVRRNT